MRHRVLLPVIVSLIASCGGGGGGGDDPDPPPGDPYADLINPGLAVAVGFANAAVVGVRVVAPVSEAEMQADLNADGDMLDNVLHEIDAGTDVVANLGLAIVGAVIASDLQFAFLVPEAGQANTDLNGDTDTGDAVWHIYSPGVAPGQGATLNTGVATPPTGLAGAGTQGGFVLPETEVSAGADLNGDGDMLDTVGAMFDGNAFGVLPTRTGPLAPATPLPARNARILLAISEAAAGATDLNGDADAMDVVLHVVDFTTGTPVLTRVGFPGGRAIATHPFGLTDNAAVYFIDEASDGGTDLNTDGDMTDAIIAVFDFAGGTGEGTPATPALPTLAVAGSPAFGFGAGAARLLVSVSEAGNGGTDLNADGDSTDNLLAWVNTSPGQQFILNLNLLPLAPAPLRIEGVRGLFAVSEIGLGFAGIDLNADGDTNDAVAHLMDTTTGTARNLGVAVGSFTLDGTDAFVGVSEFSQGGTDLNGDADVADVVLSYFDISVGAPAERRLGIVATALTLLRLSSTELRVAALMPEGQSANFGDTNQDGDILDNFVELFLFDPTAAPPGPLAPTPFFAGTASLGTAPPLRAGDAFFFPTSEASVGADLNNDGDLFDTVLRYSRIRPPSP